MFRVHGHEQRKMAHCHLQADVSDLPASCKVSGLAGHTSKHFMCPFCEMPFYRLVDPDCYDPSCKSHSHGCCITILTLVSQHSSSEMIGVTSSMHFEHTM